MSHPLLADAILECMARAAYDKHPLRNIAFKDDVIEAPPIAWEALDDFEKGMMLAAQRAAMEAMLTLVQRRMGEPPPSSKEI
jgi:hypothetical protein